MYPRQQKNPRKDGNPTGAAITTRRLQVAESARIQSVIAQKANRILANSATQSSGNFLTLPDSMFWMFERRIDTNKHE